MEISKIISILKDKKQYYKTNIEMQKYWSCPTQKSYYKGFIKGINLCLSLLGNKSFSVWKDAQGDDLPEIDREVIVLVEEYGRYKVCFAHRPVESYTGVSIINHSEIEEYYPERYDKGMWNIPNVKYWLDLDIPKMKEND